MSALLVLAALSCAAPSGPRLRISGLPEGTAALGLFVTSEGRAARPLLLEDIAKVAARQREASLDLQLPAQGATSVEIALGAFGADRCLLAMGATMAEAAAGAETALALEPVPGCPAVRAEPLAPLLLDVTPALVPSVGGSPLVVRGLGLAPDQRLDIGGVAAGNVRVRSGLLLEAEAPPLPGALGRRITVSLSAPSGATVAREGILAYYEPRVAFAPLTPVALAEGQPNLLGAAPQFLSTGDVNHDGRADLVVGWSGVARVLVHSLLGEGDGTFAASLLMEQDGSATNLVDMGVDDLNQDGLADLVLVDLGTDGDAKNRGIKLRMNTGSARTPFNAAVSLLAPAATAAAPVPLGVALVDVNGDGRLDIVASYGQAASETGGGQSTGALRIFNNQGRGVFSGDAPPECALARQPLSASLPIGDLDRDGHPDLAFSSGDSVQPRVTLFRGTARGTCATGETYALKSQPTHAGRVADLNGDGWPDLLASQGEHLTVVWNDGTGGLGGGETSVTSEQLFGSTRSISRTLLADLNGDGWMDLAVLHKASTDPTAALTILLSRREPRREFPFSLSGEGRIELPVGVNAKGLVAADFDGDGRLDLAASSMKCGVACSEALHATEQRLHVYLNRPVP